jgi:hypothetical protein
MEKLFAGIFFGVLIEHYHLFVKSATPLPFDQCLHTEMTMHDLIFLGLTLGAFGLMGLAVRALQR